MRFTSFFKWTLCVSLLLGLQASVGWAGSITESSFGKTTNGEEVTLFTLKNDTGMEVQLMSRGATIVKLIVPDPEGNRADVVLGFDNLAGYESENNPFFGCTTGRVCNRIAQGKFTLDGKEYKLAVNNGPNHLHGGVSRNFDKVVWTGEAVESEKYNAVVFRYLSVDGEEGYPGNLKCTVTFLLPHKNNSLTISYHATTDKATPINLTNHSYFNLQGEGADTVLNHKLQLHADQYTPTDDTLIPTGELAPVAGTPLDFRDEILLSEHIDDLDNTPAMGYDHNFVVNGKAGEVRPVARLVDPVSRRVLKISSTETSVQLYTGNHLSGIEGKDGKTYIKRSAVCLETQHNPDSVNHPNFPTTILRPGEQYMQTTVYDLTPGY
ncbi:aldose epimerase family protein [Planctomicrobium sp. SH668]|uniref:aldose epimerase family protein n=1 Tax=Planctomicrobium sp. SH668 TaxID=3448126 RepID=UPI003F5BB2A1